MPVERSQDFKKTLMHQAFAVSDKKTTVKNLSILVGGFLHVVSERLNGIQEVSGSIPLISTMRDKEAR